MKVWPMKFLLCGVFIAAFSMNVAAFEALPDQAPVPKDNPMSKAKIELGKQLFFDPRLSIDGTVSCNSCHNVMAGGTDSRSTSVGVNGQRGGRNAPTVWNSAFLTTQFWDGRAATLEDQAKGPPLNPIEMGMASAQAVEDRLKAIPGYVSQFRAVFGKKNAVTYDNMAKAIATYERTLITPNSAFDRFIKGDKKALTAQQQKGMKLFESIGCIACHSGANFAGPMNLAMGEGFYQKFPTYPNKYDEKYKFSKENGRFDVTKETSDKNLWRVQTLRNIAVTAPYFHNGAVKTLHEAVRVMAKSQLNKDLNDHQVNDLVAFLNSLTGEFPKQTLPRLPDTAFSSLVGSEK